MADTPDILYGNFEDMPSRFAPNEAWVYHDSKWMEMQSVEHAHRVHELTKAKWEADFPDTPPLPPEAFKTPRG